MPAWALWALRLQFSLVYFFGGIAKLKHDWLIDAQPMRIWLAASTDFPVLGPLFAQPATAHVMSVLGAAFDLTVPLFLLGRRTRPYAFAAIVVFHLVTARLFQLGLFPWLMIAAATLWLPLRSVSAIGSFRLVPAAAPALLLLVQFLLPWRHLLYPGDVLWHEQGFRFSFNVMLMEKNGSVELHVTDPATGRRWTVAPADYLTRYQAKMASSQPDMILELAHIVADDFRARGVANPEVRVDAFASLNGRTHTRLIDPTVDLAHIPRDVWSDAWILPLEG